MKHVIEEILHNPKNFESSFFDDIANKKFVVYGFGGGYHSFKQFVLDRRSVSPEIFIDQKFSDGGGGESKLSPEEFFRRYKNSAKDNIYVLVTIGNPKVYEAIKSQFFNHGFKNIHSALDIYEYNLCYANEEVYQNIREIYLRKIDQIIAAFDLLSDAASKKIFIKIISGHFNRRPINFDEYSYEDQYIVDGIGLKSENISLLDCGAYDGDTLEKFLSKYGSIELAAALECDSKSFSKLVSKDFSKINHLILLPLGSGENNQQVYFDVGNEMLSRASEAPSESSVLINLVKCDDILRGLDFNRIVIDTEGHEAPTLRGMKRLISSKSPDISVAIYHYPTDIYSIINLIHKLNGGYNFFLRNHSPFVVDTVLYAVKK
jgi:FkbM family methyltransferase